jgi:hypothetical protein
MMLTMPHDAGYGSPTIAINSQRLGEVAEESTAHFCKKYVATRYHKIPDANRFLMAVAFEGRRFGVADHNRALIASKIQPTKICIFDDQLRADNFRSFFCVQRYVSAFAAAAELQREPGLARSG